MNIINWYFIRVIIVNFTDKIVTPACKNSFIVNKYFTNSVITSLASIFSVKHPDSINACLYDSSVKCRHQRNTTEITNQPRLFHMKSNVPIR